MPLQIENLKQPADTSKYTNEQIASICPTDLGCVLEFISSKRLHDDELKEDWDAALFLLERIYCRIHQLGSFEHG